MTSFVIGVVRAYRALISPALAPSCRFYPSCSHYAEEALCRHGLVRGLVLAVKRLLRCNVLFPGGFDPVPRVSRETNSGRKHK